MAVRKNSNVESWLQANWRPIAMLFFCGMIGAHWLGFTSENLSQETVGKMFDLITISMGTYVGGRSLEKVVSTIAPILGKK